MRSYIEKTEALTGFFYDEPSRLVELIVCGKADREGLKEAYIDIQPSMDWDSWQSIPLGKVDLDEFCVIAQH